MPKQRSPTLRLRVRGPLACFTRPELKVERVSYPVITPSAARGLVEAVLWKPAIAWHIERIHVLKEIRFTAFRRNEVNSKASAPAAAVINNGGEAPTFYADEDRAQRNTVALRDVDYLVDINFTITDRAGPDENVNKFVEMFERRLEKGQHFHQPYLGCREFVADVLPAKDAPPPIGESRDLGIMLWDIQFDNKDYTPIFFGARLTKGIMDIPITVDEARNSTKKRGCE